MCNSLFDNYLLLLCDYCGDADLLLLIFKTEFPVRTKAPAEQSTGRVYRAPMRFRKTYVLNHVVEKLAVRARPCGFELVAETQNSVFVLRIIAPRVQCSFIYIHNHQIKSSILERKKATVSELAIWFIFTFLKSANSMKAKKVIFT